MATLLTPLLRNVYFLCNKILLDIKAKSTENMTVRQAFSFWLSQLLHDFFSFSGQLCNVIKYFSPHETTCFTVASMEEVVYDQTFILIKWFHIIYTLTEFWFGVFKIAQFHGVTDYFSTYTWIKIPLQLNSCLKPIQHTVIYLTKDY